MSESENLVVETLEEWLAACEARGIQTAALKKTSEIRPEAGEGHSVTVGLTAYVTLVGYRSGKLVKVRIDGDVPVTLRQTLADGGFTVREVWDNLG